MLSVKLNGNLLELRIEGVSSSEQFNKIVSIIKKIPGRMYENYVWTIPKEQIDTLIEAMDGVTRLIWHTPYSKIKNIQRKPILPDFKVSTEHMEDFLIKPYPFQTIGISFLHDVGRCMIADEMGLGKSVQIIGAVWRLFKEGKVRRALIICPASLKYQWGDEIHKFLGDKAPTVVIDGSNSKRIELYSVVNNEDILFTVINYELVRNDIEILTSIKWDCIAVDEAHRIKNWQSKTSIAIKELNATYKFAATGTPMQNRPEEIFNIFAFLDPKILGPWVYFRKRYVVIGTKFKKRNVVLGYDNLDELHDKLSKFMLRRLKSEVAPELPKMVMNNYMVPMTAAQTKLHEEIRERLYDLIKEVEEFREYDEHGNIIREHERAGQVLGMFTMLQEVCDSPQLLSMSDSRMARRYAINDVSSPKLDELYEIAEEILSSNPDAKIVIFTQFERMQRLIVERLSKLGKCAILNGKMNPVERQVAINEFKFKPDVKFFCTTDAGNYGLNLQQAQYLVNFELPWNPAVWDQRNARIHRIGSEHDVVNIINLISTGGLDERILETLYRKKAYSDIIVEKTEEQQKQMQSLTTGLMRQLLKGKTKSKKAE